MSLDSVSPEQRDWIASRAVEMLLTLGRISDPDIRENYIVLMLSGAFNQGQQAVLSAAARQLSGKWPPKPHVVGA